MHSSTKRFARFAWTPAAALLLVAALLGYQSLAAQRGVVAPSVIATVNLERVFQNLDEKGAADIELQEIADDLEAEGRTMKQAIDLSEYEIDREVLKLVSQEVCLRHKIIPVSRAGSSWRWQAWLPSAPSTTWPCPPSSTPRWAPASRFAAPSRCW